ncbi:MAG: hypothetical protein M3Z35_08970, partial [Nitrospirota bacterium]|nr:hypothetical protein [Nitrospirota bacterium]
LRRSVRVDRAALLCVMYRAAFQWPAVFSVDAQAIAKIIAVVPSMSLKALLPIIDPHERLAIL